MPDIWTGREPEAASPYYPYHKVVAANTMAGAEQLPYLLTKYLMDLPLPGYTPPSGNEYPRARLKKLIYWDGPLPLEQPLPTTQQMKSIQFDPYHPGTEPDPKRGYRIFTHDELGFTGKFLHRTTTFSSLFFPKLGRIIYEKFKVYKFFRFL